MTEDVDCGPGYSRRGWWEWCVWGGGSPGTGTGACRLVLVSTPQLGPAPAPHRVLFLDWWCQPGSHHHHHRTTHTLYCTLYTLNTLYCTLYTPNTLYCTPILQTPCTEQPAIYPILNIVYNKLHTLYAVHTLVWAGKIFSFWILGTMGKQIT